MKNQMALAVFLKVVIVYVRTVVIGLTSQLPLCKLVKESQRPEEEVVTWRTPQERHKVKNRDEIKLEEIRRMPLCVIVRTNWHLGSLICWQALH